MTSKISFVVGGMKHCPMVIARQGQQCIASHYRDLLPMEPLGPGLCLKSLHGIYMGMFAVHALLVFC